MREYRLAGAKAEIFKALGHPARIVMVEALGRRARCVSELVEMVEGSQATVSRHLEVLLRAGIVRRRREGVKMIYELALPCVLKAMPCIVDALKKRLAQQAAAIRG